MHCFVYLARCADGTLYCGVTTNLQQREHEHNHSTRGARYTRARRPVRILWCMPCQDRGAAMRLEVRIKRLPRRKKLNLLGE